MARGQKNVKSVEAPTQTLDLTPAEIEAILAARQQTSNPLAAKSDNEEAKETLAAALIQAIESTRPPSKKTISNRKAGDPWQPKDGSPKLKLKRKMFHHTVELSANQLFNEEITLLNKLKPGLYCDGFVRVFRRRDGGLDIDYPIRTASQRLRLLNQYGIRNFQEFLSRMVDEIQHPEKYKKTEEDDY